MVFEIFYPAPSKDYISTGLGNLEGFLKSVGFFYGMIDFSFSS
jgi:hypothetical protein